MRSGLRINTVTNAMFRGVQITMIYRRIGIFCLTLMIFCIACGRSDTVSGATATETPNGQAGDKRVLMENIANDPDPQKRSNVSLSAKLDRTENEIAVEYTVKNDSRGDIYVLDGQPAVKPGTKESFGATDVFYLCKGGNDAAIVLRGILPLPAHPVTRRVIPLGTKVGPNEQVTHKFSIPLPLRERNDRYVPPLEIDKYVKETVSSLVLRVQFIRGSVEEFKAEPADYAPGFFRVNSKKLVQDTETLSSEWQIGSTELLTRPDLFIRLK